jgi:hypothetical protein
MTDQHFSLFIVVFLMCVLPHMQCKVKGTLQYGDHAAELRFIYHATSRYNLVLLMLTRPNSNIMDGKRILS